MQKLHFEKINSNVLKKLGLGPKKKHKDYLFDGLTFYRCLRAVSNQNLSLAGKMRTRESIQRKCKWGSKKKKETGLFLAREMQEVGLKEVQMEVAPKNQAEIVAEEANQLLLEGSKRRRGSQDWIKGHDTQVGRYQRHE